LQNSDGVIIVDFNSDEELARFYETKTINGYEFYNNQYILIKHKEEIVDRYRWFNGKLIKLNKKYLLASNQFGKIKPKDNYQICAFDALLNDYNDWNNIVMIKGQAGSGKSLLSLAFSFSLMEKGLFDRIIMVSNCLVAKGSAKLGFYPGSRTEKVLDSFLGTFLISKIGDRSEIDKLIASDRLLLLPVGDIRGFETTKKTILYIPEAQNLDINLMKLILTRVSENTKIIIDGDIDSQVDSEYFEGTNNGMRRLSEIFKGEKVYSEIELKNIYRSEIARIASKM